ncbi:MAG: type II secretion system F family protein [Chloroflexi bacterium]|nr:type II secretion system F family protein [Chloroflexota bacterium]
MATVAATSNNRIRNYFEEITSYDLFQQLTYMSATAAAGISRARTFQLARELACPPARFFHNIHQVAENLRYNYPDAVRLIGETAKPDLVKTFLLRLSDALRSGEPLPGFLQREASVMGEAYTNDYTRSLESLKKWNDAYAAVTVSSALIVIINMVATMIYNIELSTMLLMVMIAVAASFGVAWVLLRASPPDQISVPLLLGSAAQRRARKLFFVLVPLAIMTALLLLALKMDKTYVLLASAALLLPVGWTARRADKETVRKDDEISSFLRSLGGTATSRGTTLTEALASIKIDSFPALEPDIHKLDLRLKAFGKPRLCWERFGAETGSKLVQQVIGIFYEAINLGGDPERIGKLTSEYSMRTAMLRQQRRGVAATFSWLVIVMHTVMSGLMIFLLGILGQFALKLTEAAKELEEGGASAAALGLGNMFNFNAPQVEFLGMLVIGMILILAVISAFAIVASEGAHLIKITYYLAILLFAAGLCYMFIPNLVLMVM